MLLGTSLFSYGCLVPEFTLLRIGSTYDSLFVGTWIGRTPLAKAKRWLVTGVAANQATCGCMSRRLASIRIP